MESLKSGQANVKGRYPKATISSNWALSEDVHATVFQLIVTTTSRNRQNARR